MTTKTILSAGLILVLTACATKMIGSREAIETRAPAQSLVSDAPTPQRVQVLNFATFHMGTTSDAHSTEFDENHSENQAAARDIAQRLAVFEPTIICVEVTPEKNNEMAAEFKSYLEAPSEASTYYGEVGLVAFEVARLAGLKRLHGIDHKLSYNYLIADEIDNAIDPTTLQEFDEDPFQRWPELRVDEEALSLLGKLRHFNQPAFLDFLIVVNADMLALAGTESGFEGADEAAKYYQRNLRIYSNLNRIPMAKSDRVLIISGGSHTAFLRGFLMRSPKFDVVDTAVYLR